MSLRQGRQNALFVVYMAVQTATTKGVRCEETETETPSKSQSVFPERARWEVYHIAEYSPSALPLAALLGGGSTRPVHTRRTDCLGGGAIIPSGPASDDIRSSTRADG